MKFTEILVRGEERENAIIVWSFYGQQQKSITLSCVCGRARDLLKKRRNESPWWYSMHLHFYCTLQFYSRKRVYDAYNSFIIPKFFYCIMFDVNPLWFLWEFLFVSFIDLKVVLWQIYWEFLWDFTLWLFGENWIWMLCKFLVNSMGGISRTFSLVYLGY